MVFPCIGLQFAQLPWLLGSDGGSFTRMLSAPIPRCHREPPRLVLRLQYTNQLRELTVNSKLTRVGNTSKTLDMSTIKLASPLSDPEEVGRAIILEAEGLLAGEKKALREVQNSVVVMMGWVHREPGCSLVHPVGQKVPDTCQRHKNKHHCCFSQKTLKRTNFSPK
ncbi:hypothetical protein B296_00047719 [Ensete ventricosum]|uniref:Uncharacterized protein n=1 Tax=Ensete ventricosum TaxID=4639 RepID=A0A426X4X0_ENSVE|nr:hypothetical protein B296_00047719 [Ensete ventricosum]